MGNPAERASQEHLQLYDCYADLVREAVTHTDRDLTDRHLGEAQDWYRERLTGADWRNAKEADAALEQQKQAAK